MAWRIAWDAPSEATEFDDAYDQLTADLPFATAELRTGAAQTIVLHASSTALLNRVQALLAD